MTKPMRLQEFLRNGGTPAELLEQFAIKTTRHREQGHLVLFKYNQIDSPFSEPIVRECRGVVLDEEDNWNVVSRSFDKFFNHGEGLAAEIDWSTARVQEKIDGSLCTVYHYDGAWHVATTGMPDAAGEVNGMGFTFADLFWRAVNRLPVSTMPEDTDLCLMFELTSQYNRIVVPHRDLSVTLLAVRNRRTMEEIPVEQFADRYPIVKSYPLQSIADIEATFLKLNPLDQEGYVVVDGRFNRIKVKHPGYVAIHGLRDGFGPRRLLELIRTGEQSELLSYYPEWKPDFDRIETRFNDLVADLLAEYEGIKHIPVQKDFALQAVKSRCSGALFAVRSGKVRTFREYLAGINIKGLMSMLSLKDEEPADIAA